MQNLKLYTRYFKPSIADKRVFNKVKKSFYNFNIYYKNHIPTNSPGHIQWKYEDNSLYNKEIEKVLKPLSKYFMIKVMYNDNLDPFLEPVKGYLFIGDGLRVQIALHIWEYLLETFENYSRFLLRYYTYKGRAQSSKEFTSLITNIVNCIENELEVDLNYVVYLERFIMRHYRLDFKDYQGKKEFFHAESKYYYHKRIMI